MGKTFGYHLLLVICTSTYARLQPRIPQQAGLVPPTAETCMDPISQPQLTINGDCPSSRTNLSDCLNRDQYKKRCLVYCEQFLYWFSGPEVPWPNAKCSADGDCTFNNAKGVAITNGYTFSAGLGGTLSDAFKLAFDLGATYSYSYQTSSTQTFSLTKPASANGSCGYWTFLPYYVSSCGFYLESQRITGNDWGAYFFGNTYEYCDSNYEIRFGCTNTTYKDADGNAEGETVFVKTDCRTNARLNIGSQDERYANLVTQQVTSFAFYQHADAFLTPPPFSDEVCKIGCYCSYNRRQRSRYETTTRYSAGAGLTVNWLSTRKTPYEACGAFDDYQDDTKYLNCTNLLLNAFANSNIPRNSRTPSIPLTSRNMTLLKYYGAIPCNASEGEGSYGRANFTSSLSQRMGMDWHWVADGTDGVYQNPYDCYGNSTSIGPVMNNFTFNASPNYNSTESDPPCLDTVIRGY